MTKSSAHDVEKVREFLERGVENVYPSKDFVEKKLLSERSSVYLGLDPTGPTLHIGHAFQFRKLSLLQKLGHKIILLIGDFTAMIGDPTDKTAARIRLTREQVLENAKNYQKQASTFLDFEGPNKAELKYNSEWLAKMNFEQVLDLAAHMTVEQMLKRDMFDRRITEGKPIYIHEFMYPLMQGYDSVVLGVDGEIGGNDQTFNMLAGRTLAKQMQNREKFVVSFKLLTDTNGKKMGKSEGNMITLQDTPQEMFGKVLSWTDGMILPGFELCTDVSAAEMGQIAKDIAAGENPKLAKVRLAKEIITLYHGKKAADEAEAGFQSAFVKGGLPADTPEAVATKGADLYSVLKAAGLVASKGELRRLVEEGAVSEIGGDKISSIDFAFEKDMDLKVGKRRFLKVRVS